MAAVTYVDSTYSQFTGGVCSIPSGSAGDLLIAHVFSSAPDFGATQASESGWTVALWTRYFNFDFGGQWGLTTLLKVRGPSEPSTNFIITGPDESITSVVIIDTTPGVLDFAAGTNQFTPYLPTATFDGGTVAENDSYIAAALGNTLLFDGASTPAGFTLHETSSPGIPEFYAFGQDSVSAGALAAFTSTLSFDSGWLTHTIVIKPEAETSGGWVQSFTFTESNVVQPAPRVQQPLPGIVPYPWVQEFLPRAAPAVRALPSIDQPLPGLAPYPWVQEFDLLPPRPRVAALFIAQVYPSTPAAETAWCPQVFPLGQSSPLRFPEIALVFPEVIPEPVPPVPPRPRKHTVVGTPGGGFPTHTIYADPEPYQESSEYRQLFSRFSGLIEQVEQKIETKEAEVRRHQSSARFWSMLTLGIIGARTAGIKGVFVGLSIATLITTPRLPASQPKLLPSNIKKLSRRS